MRKDIKAVRLVKKYRKNGLSYRNIVAIFKAKGRNTDVKTVFRWANYK